jgi:glutamine synthetase
MPVVRDELKANIDTILKWQDLELKSEVNLFKNHIEVLAEKFNLMIMAMKKLAESLNEENYELIVLNMQELREIVDFLEENVDGRNWPLPKYREMLFIY